MTVKDPNKPKGKGGRKKLADKMMLLETWFRESELKEAGDGNLAAGKEAKRAEIYIACRKKD